ncbi:hypothetical protein F4703DRAFT_1938057 [Phycomyces blakesleeanus]
MSESDLIVNKHLLVSTISNLGLLQQRQCIDKKTFDDIIAMLYAQFDKSLPPQPIVEPIIKHVPHTKDEPVEQHTKQLVEKADNTLPSSPSVQPATQSPVQSTTQLVTKSPTQYNVLPVSKPLAQSTVQPLPQSPAQSTVQPLPQSPAQSTVQSASQSPLQSNTQSASPSPLQSHIQSTSQLPVQPSTQNTAQPVAQPVAQLGNQATNTPSIDIPSPYFYQPTVQSPIQNTVQSPLQTKTQSFVQSPQTSSSSPPPVYSRPVPKVPLGRVVAVYDFVATKPIHLTFKKGDIIQVTDHINTDWSQGSLGRNSGIFPRNRVKPESLTSSSRPSSMITPPMTPQIPGSLFSSNGSTSIYMNTGSYPLSIQQQQQQFQQLQQQQIQQLQQQLLQQQQQQQQPDYKGSFDGNQVPAYNSTTEVQEPSRLSGLASRLGEVTLSAAISGFASTVGSDAAQSLLNNN